MITIRRMDLRKEWELLQKWWEASGQTSLTPDMVPPTTFLAEEDGEPLVSLSLTTSNTLYGAELSFFVGNPEKKGPARREATREIFLFVEGLAKLLGYRKLYGFASNAKLGAYYNGLGYDRIETQGFYVTKEI